VISGTAVNLSLHRASARCALAVVLIWAALPVHARPAELYGESAIAPLIASPQPNITDQSLAPTVSFAKKSDKGGGGGSSDSGKDEDRYDAGDSDDIKAGKSQDTGKDKKDSDDRPATKDKQAENGNKKKDDKNDKKEKKNGDANKDKQKKDDKKDKKDKKDKQDSDDRPATKDKQAENVKKNDKKDQEAKQAENGNKNKDRENDKKEKKKGDANKDKQSKGDKKDEKDKDENKDKDEDRYDAGDSDDSEAGKSQDTGKDKKDSDDRPATKDKQAENGKKNKGREKDKQDNKDKQDKNGKKDKDDNKDKQEEDDEKDKDQDRDDSAGSDEQESQEDRHDHDSNEGHDHDNGAAEDQHDHETEEGRHDHETEEGRHDHETEEDQHNHETEEDQHDHEIEESRHDHHEDDGHADSESAEHHEEFEHGDGGDPSTQEFASSDENSEQANDDVSEETLEEQLAASEPAATFELSGIPPDSVTAGDPYLFRPAVECDGQSTPVFSITGQPLWASFDEVTGELSGTPRETDVGIYEPITISATDGSVETSLAPFSIAVGTATGSVTLSWTPPLENEDGSPLVDLAGYWIYWQNGADTGTDTGTDTESMKIDNPGLSTIVIDNLAAGTYEFAMTSFNLDGIESARSNAITRIVEAGAGAGEAAGADAATDTTETAASEGEPDVAAAMSESTPFLVIAGTPPEAVTADTLYLFTPSVESSGESQPTFAIDGLPHWAGFNEINGELYGAPAEQDIGFYDAITISATDGVVETSLPTFSIEVVAPGAALGAVTLSWMPPTENADGSYLADLAGYWIYWGNNPGTYTQWMRIDSPGLTTVVIERVEKVLQGPRQAGSCRTAYNL
jgi:hypothetical protein